ncbi:MAG TPA: OmpA family protein [Prosthecobacter sp.]|nr:OmpA family protein [Prosthecobacter sp.]
MKPFIQLAFATLAMPLLAVAQTSAPPSDEEKPLVPKVPVPAPETVVPAVPPVLPGGAAPDQPPAAVPAVPAVTEKRKAPGLDRPAPPGTQRPAAPGAKRRGPPGAKDQTGAPTDPAPAPPSADPAATPSADPKRAMPAPGTERSSAEAPETPGTPPATRGKGKGRAIPGTPPGTPSNTDTPPATPGTPTATTDTPPATPGTSGTPETRGKGEGRVKGRDVPGTPPAPPGTIDTPPATPGTTGMPPATPGTPPATPGTTGEPPATPGTTSTPPAGSGKGKGKERITPGKGRDLPGAPPVTPGTTATPPVTPGTSATPPATPGTPMPSVTTTPGAPGDPKAAERPEGRDRPERPAAQKPPSQETAKVLEDEPKRDRQADAAQARQIDNPEEAKRLLLNILGGAVGVGVGPNNRPSNVRPDDRRRGDGRRYGYRPSVEEVGRTQQDRERTVTTIVERFQGRDLRPQAVPSGRGYREERIFFDPVETQRRPQFYDGNRRVIRYSSMQEIPPVIIASQQLNRVELMPQARSPYQVRPPAPQQQQQARYQSEIPPSYTSGDAYAVSYKVDPDSAISTDAILFRQGSTDFADAYSYDLVIDMAEAMKAPALTKETFVIEGHASAEGDYAQNLQLSQERAERISRELVRHGVSAERLMPVGYGEAEAAYPADAAEAERRLDRRVVVFRMKNES